MVLCIHWRGTIEPLLRASGGIGLAALDSRFVFWKYLKLSFWIRGRPFGGRFAETIDL